MSEIYIESALDFLDLMKNRKIKEISYVFRGEADCTWKLVSTLERKIGDLGECNDPADFELRIVQKFKELYPDWYKYDTLGLLAIMRHYGVPTRLLDVTFNPLAALYFACSDDDHSDKDGKVRIFPTYAGALFTLLSRILANTASMIKNGVADLDNIYRIHAALDMRVDDEKSKIWNLGLLTRLLTSGHMLYSPCYTDNQRRQSGTFMMVTNEYDENAKKFNNRVKYSNTVERLDESVPDYVLISSAAKKKILDELRFFGVCESVLLPENDKIKKYAHILEEVKKEAKVL